MGWALPYFLESASAMTATLGEQDCRRIDSTNIYTIGFAKTTAKIRGGRVVGQLRKEKVVGKRTGRFSGERAGRFSEASRMVFGSERESVREQAESKDGRTSSFLGFQRKQRKH